MNSVDIELIRDLADGSAADRFGYLVARIGEQGAQVRTNGLHRGYANHGD
jgi:hypothetical protein